MKITFTGRRFTSQRFAGRRSSHLHEAGAGRRALQAAAVFDVPVRLLTGVLPVGYYVVLAHLLYLLPPVLEVPPVRVQLFQRVAVEKKIIY